MSSKPELKEPPYVWIKTQDGSSTLWNNELGEPFRSVKGAFHESLEVFVKPAIVHAKTLLENNPSHEIIVGEFGLGAGTNWLLFSQMAHDQKIPFRYFAIEKDLRAFEFAMPKWQSDFNLDKLCRPQVFPSIESALQEFEKSKLKADLWFHDPFGFSLNPEGYSQETLKSCAQLWAPHFLGLSYACNSNFQKQLRDIGMQPQSVELDAYPLKRESLKFRWA